MRLCSTWLALGVCASIDPMPSEAAPPKSTSAASPVLRRLIMLALLLGAFALRLYHLGAESLWYDETVSAYLALQTPAALVAHTARDIHPPAYYLLLHLWQLLSTPTPAFGLEFLLAWPSLWIGALGLALTYTLGKRWFGVTAALVALAAAGLQPFQVWYAQEVRMYALGAFCVLITLWAVTPWLVATTPNASNDLGTGGASGPSTRGLATYVVAAALGLYTLYYFLFWLVVLNACLMFCTWSRRRERRRWLIAQVIVLLLWLPWLPIFIRQVLAPPVPVWRVPWQWPTDFNRAIVEGLSAQLTAHTQPLEILWPWAVVVVSLYAAALVASRSRAAVLLTVLSLAPFGLLLAVSSLGAPIYHVRYLAIYASIFPLVFACIAAVARPFRTAAITLTLIVVGVVASLSLFTLWTDPRYAADDHRQAVADLAYNWRPGDAILVNAGWVYTALAVDRPRELPAPDSFIPPDIQAFPRLTDIPTSDGSPSGEANLPPLIYRSGSIDGPGTLGWGRARQRFLPDDQG